jgi:hypothetical protein
VNYDRQHRSCVVCGKEGMAPEVMPYLGKVGHVWAHQVCAAEAYLKQSEKRELHENGDGV